jgi:hypothetical protein
MFEVTNYILNLIGSGFEHIFANCFVDINYEENNINLKPYFICPICSYNISNTMCYEIGCINYGQQILHEF